MFYKINLFISYENEEVFVKKYQQSLELFVIWLKLKVSILELEDEIQQLFWWLKIVQDNEKFESPPQFWKEAFNNNFR